MHARLSLLALLEAASSAAPTASCSLAPPPQGRVGSAAGKAREEPQPKGKGLKLGAQGGHGMCDDGAAVPAPQWKGPTHATT